MSLPREKFKVLGVDISKNSTGWSIIEIDNVNGDRKLKLVNYGYIPTAKLSHGEALVLIEKKISIVVEKYQPRFAALEQMFVGKNASTSMTLANAHGVVLLVCAKSKIPVNYYAVMTIKSQTLGGIKTKKEDGSKKTGDEMKAEVSRKIIDVFGANSFVKDYNDDVTDSISAAYTFVLMDGKEIEKKKKTRKKKATK